MADYISQGVFHPSFPKHLISNEDRRIIEAFGINIKPDDDSQILLFAADWCNRGIIVTEDSKDDIKFTEDDLYARFQEIIRRSNGELTWISRETAYTCTENRPDGFGGSALFITAETMQFIATDAWLDELGDSQTKSIPLERSLSETTRRDVLCCESPYELYWLKNMFARHHPESNPESLDVTGCFN